jgi:type II secretory pathway component PulJ
MMIALVILALILVVIFELWVDEDRWYRENPHAAEELIRAQTELDIIEGS